MPHTSPTTQLIRPFKILLIFCGIYLPTKLRSVLFIRIIHRIILGFLFTFQISCFVATIYAVHHFYDDFHQRTFFLSALIWHFDHTLSLYFLVKWTHRGSVTNVLVQLRKANQERGVKANLGNHKSFLIIVMSLILSITVGIIVSLPIWLHENISDLPFAGHLWFHIILLLGTIHGVICWQVATAVFTTCCHFIWSEIAYLNDDIRSSAPITFDRVQCLLKTHVQLSMALRMVNDTFGTYVFCLLSVTIPGFILLLYNLVFVTQIFLFVLLIVVLLISIVHLMGLTYYPAKIYEEASQSTDAVRTRMAMEADIWEDTKLCNLTFWLIKQSESELGVSANGYFVMTKSLALTVLSLVVTYLTLLVQSTSLPQYTPANNTTFDGYWY